MKRWTEPKLFVLTRGRPEEAVLEVCKNHPGSYANASNSDCGWGSKDQPCIGVTGT